MAAEWAVAVSVLVLYLHHHCQPHIRPTHTTLHPISAACHRHRKEQIEAKAKELADLQAQLDADTQELELLKVRAAKCCINLFCTSPDPAWLPPADCADCFRTNCGRGWADVLCCLMLGACASAADALAA